MSKPQDVNDLVTRMRPAALCNKCIARELHWLNETAHPAQITAALATTSDFIQEVGVCSVCQCQVKVIHRA